VSALKKKLKELDGTLVKIENMEETFGAPALSGLKSIFQTMRAEAAQTIGKKK